MSKLKAMTCQVCGHPVVDIWRSVTSFPRWIFVECPHCHWCGPRRLTKLGAKIAWNRMQKKIKKVEGEIRWKR